MKASTILLGGVLGSIALATAGLIAIGSQDPARASALSPSYALATMAILAVASCLAVSLRHVETTY